MQLRFGLLVLLVRHEHCFPLLLLLIAQVVILSLAYQALASQDMFVWYQYFTICFSNF